eukprot:CFRG8205T1
MHSGLDANLFGEVLRPSLIALYEHFELEGYGLRLVGGVVRDLFMGITPKDVDLATTATPEEMIALFEKHGYKYIPTGLQHGTLTVHTQCGIDYEITTLRIDTITDGRHAEVDFTTSWVEDAARRDLTVNAMFLGINGELFDYYDGLVHLHQKKVVFVGSAAVRICEDYLRILRYFRFHGRIASNPYREHDTPTLQAIRQHAAGLRLISGERIWLEMARIITGPNAGAELMAMSHLQTDVAQYIDIPNAAFTIDRISQLDRIRHLTSNPITCLVSLLDTQDEFMTLVDNYKMSRKETSLGMFLIANRDACGRAESPSRMGVCMGGNNNSNSDRNEDVMFKHGTDFLVDAIAPEFAIELMMYLEHPSVGERLRNWEVKQFPVNGKMMASTAVKKGPDVGVVLKELKSLWKESSYQLGGDELLEKVPGLLSHIDELRANMPKVEKIRKRAK